MMRIPQVRRQHRPAARKRSDRPGACYRALLSADDVAVGRKERRGRGIQAWVIIPNTLGFGGRTRMAGQPEFGPHPHRTRSQRSRVVCAAGVAAAVFVVVASLVWLGVWLPTHVVQGRFLDGFFAPLTGVGCASRNVVFPTGTA